MEIFFIAAKANAQHALSGGFQLCLPAPNQRILLAAGAFVAPEEPWQRRARAKSLEKLLQDAAASVKSAADLWSQLAKKLPEIAQAPFVFGLLLEDGSLEARLGGLGSLLIKSELKQKILALQEHSLSLSAEVMAGAKELLFFEDPVDRAEEIAALLQDTEQALGEAAVRRLLVAAPSDPIAAPAARPVTNTPREVAVPLAPTQGWQQYAPWGVAAGMTLLLLVSLVLRPSTPSPTSTKSMVVDTRPKFIPQLEEPETKKPEKTGEPSTPKSPSSKPVSPLVAEAPASAPATVAVDTPTKAPEKPPEKTTKTTTKTTKPSTKKKAPR